MLHSQIQQQAITLVRAQQILLQDVGQTPKAVLPHPRRALCMAFPSENAILSGSEEGAVQLWDPRTASKPVAVIPHAHKTRVKDIAPLSSSIADQAAGVTASASSDGVVKLWDFRKVVIDSKGVSKTSWKQCSSWDMTCTRSGVGSPAWAILAPCNHCCHASLLCFFQAEYCV